MVPPLPSCAKLKKKDFSTFIIKNKMLYFISKFPLQEFHTSVFHDIDILQGLVNMFAFEELKKYFHLGFMEY